MDPTIAPYIFSQWLFVIPAALAEAPANGETQPKRRKKAVAKDANKADEEGEPSASRPKSKKKVPKIAQRGSKVKKLAMKKEMLKKRSGAKKQTSAAPAAAAQPAAWVSL